MILTALAVAAGGLVVSAGSASIGFYAGLRRGAGHAEADAETKAVAVRAQRDAAERRARETDSENARWRANSLAGKSLNEAPVYRDRTSPRDAEALARLVRGLTFVDEVVLADASGSPLTRATSEHHAAFAALAPAVLQLRRRLAGAAIGLLDVSFETFEARHVHARPLGGRAEGAVLLVGTTSREVNPLVVDAVAHASVRDTVDVPSRAPISLLMTGTTDRRELEKSGLAPAFALLEAELTRGPSAIVLSLDGRPVFSAANDGPEGGVRVSAAVALSALAEQATRRLRTGPMARVEVTLPGGFSMSWTPLGPGSRLALVTFGRTEALSAPRTNRLIGMLRRTIDVAQRAPLAAGSAA